MKALAIVGGYGADLAFGDPRRFHPVAGFGTTALALERAMYAPRRSAGVAYVALLVGGAAALGRSFGTVTPVRGANVPHVRLLASAAAVWSVLGGRSLAREAGKIADLVAADDLDGARRAIPALVGRDPSALDDAGLCRAAIESVAENTVDAVVAPLLWTAAAGPAGALGHRAANTLDAMVGHHSERYEDFGWAAARLDDVLNWPAARVGAALTVLLAPLVGGDPQAARAVQRRDAHLHPSPNGGQVEAAFAGALGLRLGGPVTYGDRQEDRPWLGDGAAPGPDDVRRAIRLASLVGASSALLAALARERLA